ncbi:MAG: M48 family metallopeptidase [Candidatus Methanoplasma sp.]|jgi:predicted metal-dependent hydrolase|nr:M48 family metallopeptidase [Candidatus Methanoplasma sp.]
MISYTIVRSGRRTQAIHIKSDGSVEVRAPLGLAESEIERFVSSKSDWIDRKLAEVSAMAESRPAGPLRTEYPPGGFERAARGLVAEWEPRLGVKASSVSIRGMSSRWGSCTPGTGRIRLNSALEFCPRECLEYVVVHELAHLRESGHSPRFWAIVSSALPGYGARKSELRRLQWILDARRGDG